MYIAFGTLAGNDPRLDSQYKIITNWWHYTIAEVPDDKYIEWLSPVILTEAETRADVIVDAVDDEISVRKSVAKRGKLIGYSGDDEEANDKIVHVLTKEEKQVAYEFLKKILINFVEKELANFKEQAKIKKAISAATTLDQLKIIMAQHCDYKASENMVVPEPEFKLTSWKNPEIVSLLIEK
jgi:hypothetical protein